jgi:glycogen debranching enzyme
MIERKGAVQEVIQLQDDFYILSTSSLADDRTSVLKQDDTFALFDRHGDVHPLRFGDQGLYHNGTRYLSRMELKLGEQRPLLLSSRVVDDNRFLAVDMTNPDILVNGRVGIPRGTLHIFRSKFLVPSRCHEKLRLSNYGAVEIEVHLRIRMSADFADIFEVRGMKRPKRGEMAQTVEGNAMVISYVGLDGVQRQTRVESTPAPTKIENSELFFSVRLAPKEETVVTLSISCSDGRPDGAVAAYEEAFAAAEEARVSLRSGGCQLKSANERFDTWISRSSADLQTMITRTEHGLYPFAGVPWFSTVFGRDGIITALECLWMNPNIARGVLAFLAAHQAREDSAERDAEPGKILHEMRGGEMANLKEIPFGLYYGSVDSTPLFVMLAAAYYRRTGDLAFVKQLWPAVEAALRWIDRYGDMDGDGFVEYARKTPAGLANQGWKDSNDSVFHEDGKLAQGPIALCEVQGYVYDAKASSAFLAEALGHHDRAAILRRQAEELRKKFDEAFWCQDLATYALALDGDKRACRVRTSNAAHALFTGIATEERAKLLVGTLFSEDSFSGWGIRTVSSKESLYNPMSYHNGSIWPHDNAMAAAGLARYGRTAEAAKVMSGLFDASGYLETQRLPELFCGFRRRGCEGPTHYPVACSPQAWASGSVFLLLQSCLGLQIDGIGGRVTLRRPTLPAYLDWLEIRNLQVGGGSIDLALERHEMDVGAKILRRQGPIEVTTII